MDPDAAARAALDRVGGTGDVLDPATLIGAVALLHRLGHDGSARVLTGHTGPEQDDTGVILVARLLYVPGGEGPLDPPGLGRPDVDLRGDPVTCPSCPLLVSDDIPFLPVGGWFVGGAPASARRYVQTVAGAGALRPHPLTPTGSPVDAAERLLASSSWARVVPDAQQAYARSLVYRQAVRASAEADWDVREVTRSLAPGGEDALVDTWRSVVDGSGARGLRWDTRTGSFTGPAGAARA